jgi:type IV pilus assembly protein PilC
MAQKAAKSHVRLGRHGQARRQGQGRNPGGERDPDEGRAAASGHRAEDRASGNRRCLWANGKKITAGDIAVFSRQLATMMSAGVPWCRVWTSSGAATKTRPMQKLVLDIKTDVEGGTNLSEALAKHPLYFNELFCNLVEAGESGGVLDTLLDKLATYLEKTESIKKKIKKALFYPAAVLVVAFHRHGDPALLRSAAVREPVPRLRRRPAGVHAVRAEVVLFRAGLRLAVHADRTGGRIVLFVEAKKRYPQYASIFLIGSR